MFFRRGLHRHPHSALCWLLLQRHHCLVPILPVLLHDQWAALVRMCQQLEQWKLYRSQSHQWLGHRQWDVLCQIQAHPSCRVLWVSYCMRVSVCCQPDQILSWKILLSNHCRDPNCAKHFFFSTPDKKTKTLIQTNHQCLVKACFVYWISICVCFIPLLEKLGLSLTLAATQPTCHVEVVVFHPANPLCEGVSGHRSEWADVLFKTSDLDVLLGYVPARLNGFYKLQVLPVTQTDQFIFPSPSLRALLYTKKKKKSLTITSSIS